jgi:hypothetical protein
MKNNLSGVEQIGCYFSMLYRIVETKKKVDDNQKRFILSGLERGIESVNKEAKRGLKQRQLELAI